MSILYIITFLGAFLLFQLELIVAQKLLPLYGGGFSIWATCMMFYQFFLLLGYFYAHFLTHSSLRKKAIFQICLLFLSLLFFPFEFKFSNYFESPIVSIGFLLAQSIGFPFLLLSSTAIVQQKWLANNPNLHQSESPYILYSMSNIGSFVALLTYPFFFQPIFKLHTQLMIWYTLYGFYIVLHFFCLPQFDRVIQQATEEDKEKEKISLNKKHLFLWFFINVGTCSLLVSVTNIITMDISPAPILWVFPLAAYLFSFTIVFSEKKSVKLIILLSSVFSGIYFLWLNSQKTVDNFYWLIFYPIFLFTICCIMNRLLIHIKPHSPKHLTLFYIIISLGSFVGTVFINFFIPVLMRSFPSIFIDLYVSMIILFCCLFAYFFNSFHFLFRHAWLKYSVFAIMGFFIFYFIPTQLFFDDPHLKFSHRNFYGICKVTETEGIRWFTHGSVHHGAQPIDPEKENEPFYYNRENGPIHNVFKVKEDLQKIAIFGLGTAGFLSLSKKEQNWDFYEIDPDMLEIAQTQFTYLKNTLAKTKIYLGDARLKLQKVDQKYDLIFINAFSGDSIPTHLITYEAFSSYFEKIEEDGFLTLHCSNRYLDILPVLVKITEELHLFSAYKFDGNVFLKHAPPVKLFMATRSKELHQKIISEYQWTDTKKESFKDVSLWTDEKVNIIETFDFSSDVHLIQFLLNQMFEKIE